jgi:isopenicillin N synthase-like dioxygenase
MTSLSFAHNPVPVIDLARFRAGEDERAALAREVDAACSEIGFLVVTGHGLDPRLIEQVDAIGRRLFDLPDETKRRCAGPVGSITRGYQSVGARALARTHGDLRARPDWRETFTMGRPTIDASDPYFGADIGRMLFQPNVFPVELPEMQPLMERYYAAMTGLATELMQLFALALGLDENWFAARIDRHITNLTITNYPDQPQPPEPGQLRAGAHTDFGTLTILRAEDRPGGLEVCTPGGDWVTVPVLPDSYIINIGDLMARWTNDRWRSTLHRVVNPPRDSTGSTRRQSIIFFHQPNHDAEIRCLPSCVGDGARYEPTTSGEHLVAKMGRSRATA